ncbi:MAG: hypothetical protein E7166_05540 [Firmicutes bacterium]|nr:hypothetical protein [Bacillota bacterium]
MPSTVTHAYFAIDVIDKLDNKTKKILNNNIANIKTFGQGSDPLYFYYLALPIIGKNVRNTYPRLIHDTNTKDFFITLIDEIKTKKLEYDSQIISMLYGFICHYTLDSTIHPYIIYKTGIYDKDKPETYKYRSLHLDMELYLDGYMIFQREKMPIQNFKLHEFCFEKNNISIKTKEVLDAVFKKVYNIDNYSKYYLKAIKHTKEINRFFRYDKYGIKKVGYIILDMLLPKKQLKKEQLSYHIDYRKKMHYLNNEKNEWNHPMDEYETYTYSFIELYHIALDKAVKIIDKVNAVLYDNEDLKILDKTFKNISHKTGKDCNDKRKLLYFEY